MKYFFIFLFSIATCLHGKTQPAPISQPSRENNHHFYQLYQLDSIGHSPSIGRHFGELYYNFLLLVEEQLKKTDTSTQRLIRNFETVFARFFIDACYAYKNSEPIQLAEWRNYFVDSTLQPIQYYLLGA